MSISELLKVEFVLCPDPEENAPWFREKLFPLKQSFYSVTLPEPPVTYSYSTNLTPEKKILSPPLTRSNQSPERNITRSNQSPERNPTRSNQSPERSLSPFPTTFPTFPNRSNLSPERFDTGGSSYREYNYNKTLKPPSRYLENFVNRSWQEVTVKRLASPISPFKDQRANTARDVPFVEDFEDLRKRIYRDVLFDLIALRRKVENSRVLKGFGKEARLLYDRAFDRFNRDTMRFLNMPLFAEKKAAFMEKIENDLYDLFETQVGLVKNVIKETMNNKFDSLRERLEQGKNEIVILLAYENL